MVSLSKQKDDGVEIIIVVLSRLTNREKRDAIRKSWAQDQRMFKNIRVVFLIGSEDTFLPDLSREAAIYGDIIQEHFADNYINLTIKSLMMLKWFHNTCSGKIV